MAKAGLEEGRLGLFRPPFPTQPFSASIQLHYFYGARLCRKDNHTQLFFSERRDCVILKSAVSKCYFQMVAAKENGVYFVAHIIRIFSPTLRARNTSVTLLLI